MPIQYNVILETPDGEVILKVGKDETILDVALSLREGADLPHTCVQGWCVTCSGRLVEGEVDQSDALRVYPEDESAGFILLCSAVPRTDLRIKTHQQEALKRLRKKHNLPAPVG